VGDSEFTGDSGWVGIITEPLAQLGGVVPLDDATAIEWETWEPDNWGIYPAAGDFNGDGLADLVVGTNNPESDGESKAVLLFGRSEAEGSLSPEDEPTILAEDPAFDNFASLRSAGDLDGDGLDEILIAQMVNPDSLYVVRGMDLPLSDRVTVSDIASEIWRFSDGAKDCMGGMGDVDHDGLDDWFAGTAWFPEGYDKYGAIYLMVEELGGDSGSTLSVADATTRSSNYIVGEHEGQGLGHECTALDLNGDRMTDVMTLSVSVDGRAEYEILSGHTLLNGPASASQAGLTLADRSYLNAGDYDGDGDDDLLVQYWDEELYPAGFSGVGILPGWDVPWDDPDLW